MVSISEGVAISWDDPQIRADRLKRWRCIVDGTEYSSVHQACLAIANFEGREHQIIPWRRRLVLNAENGDDKGLLDHNGRHWQVYRIR